MSFALEKTENKQQTTRERRKNREKATKCMHSLFIGWFFRFSCASIARKEKKNRIFRIEGVLYVYSRNNTKQISDVFSFHIIVREKVR